MQKNQGQRHDGRRYDQLRPLKVSYDLFGYADSSLLFEMGNTKVLCSVSLQQGVPAFLRGKHTGWLSAEYAMLPTATMIRKPREIAVMRKNGRSVEISRLIGRCLRSIINLEPLGERTITVDCDVLQADGGTRTACITGAYVALKRAVNRWIQSGLLQSDPLRDSITAISVGLKDGVPLLDLDFVEDNGIDADFNFVITQSGNIVEVQGTAEKYPMAWQKFNQICELATKGVKDLFAFFAQDIYEQSTREIKEVKKESKKEASQKQKQNPKAEKSARAPLFSLQNRLQSTEHQE